MKGEIYPLTIIFDRYGGTYSGAKFTAWNLEAEQIPTEINDDDCSCDGFWITNDKIVGLGDTAEKAIKDLENKINMQISNN